jgi:hypothetical protein
MGEISWMETYFSTSAFNSLPSTTNSLLVIVNTLLRLGCISFSPFMGEISWMETRYFLSISNLLFKLSLYGGNQLNGNLILSKFDKILTFAPPSPFMGEISWMETILSYFFYFFFYFSLPLWGKSVEWKRCRIGFSHFYPFMVRFFQSRDAIVFY